MKGVVGKVALGPGRRRVRLRHRREAGRRRGDRDPDPGLGAAARPLRDRGRRGVDAEGGRPGVDRPGARPGGPGGARPRRASASRETGSSRVGVAVAAGITLLFLLLPIVAIFARVPPGDLVSALGRGQATDALLVSLETNLIALARSSLLGTPTAWLIATSAGRLRDLSVTLVELPLVLPPAVAGIGLLAAFGRVGLVGGHIHVVGPSLAFTKAAVVVAIAFVASPFYIRSAIAAFESRRSRDDRRRRARSAPGRRARSCGSPFRLPPAGSGPGLRSPSPAASASSARRSCSPAACAASPRRSRWRSTRRSTSTSTSRSRSAPSWS